MINYSIKSILSQSLFNANYLMTQSSSAKFDNSRASEYAVQSQIGLAGYEACHDLTACVLAASLGRGSHAQILIVGAGGTGYEVLKAGALEPNWQFMAVDPSQPMLELAMSAIHENGFGARTQAIQDDLDKLPTDTSYDAATLIGVLHHVPSRAAKLALLRQVADRLKKGAPFILACNHRSYSSEPLLMKAWGERWRQHGATPEEIETKLGKILKGAEPPESENDVFTLLEASGFIQPKRFFSSLFWSAWVSWKT